MISTGARIRGGDMVSVIWHKVTEVSPGHLQRTEWLCSMYFFTLVRISSKQTTTILRAATTTSTIKRRCAVARSVFVWVVCSAVVCSAVVCVCVWPVDIFTSGAVNGCTGTPPPDGVRPHSDWELVQSGIQRRLGAPLTYIDTGPCPVSDIKRSQDKGKWYGVHHLAQGDWDAARQAMHASKKTWAALCSIYIYRSIAR